MKRADIMAAPATSFEAAMAHAFDTMPGDENRATWLLATLGPADREWLLASLPPAQRQRLQQLLAEVANDGLGRHGPPSLQPHCTQQVTSANAHISRPGLSERSIDGATTHAQDRAPDHVLDGAFSGALDQADWLRQLDAQQVRRLDLLLRPQPPMLSILVLRLPGAPWPWQDSLLACQTPLRRQELGRALQEAGQTPCALAAALLTGLRAALTPENRDQLPVEETTRAPVPARDIGANRFVQLLKTASQGWSSRARRALSRPRAKAPESRP